MSYVGKNLEIETLTSTPQAADPENPTEGMSYYSDGTNRAKGTWTYTNGAWVTSDVQIVQEKFQVRYLPSNISTNGTLTSLSFSNLTIGKVYELEISCKTYYRQIQSSGFTTPESGLAAQNGGIDVSIASSSIFRSQSTGSSQYTSNLRTSTRMIFTALTSTVTVRSFGIVVDSITGLPLNQIIGTGNSNGSYAILKEINAIPTTEFNP